MKIHFGALGLVLATALLAATAARSAPQGRNLLPAVAGQVTSFAFDPANPDIVYVGTIPGTNKGRVYRSTDGGEHWRLISGRRWTWLGALAADPRRPGTLYAGTGTNVYKTTDGGRTWRASNRGLLPPPGINRGEGWVDWLAVDPTNSSVLYEHDYANTIRKSVDSGQSWRPVLSLWKRGYIANAGLLLAPSGRPTLYAAFDLPSLPGGPAFPPRSSISGPRGAHTGVYATTDGGKTWRNTGLAPWSEWPRGAVVAFAADPRRKTIYVAVGARVFSSKSAGGGWRFIGQGLPQDGVVTGLAAGAGTVWAAFGEQGIYETTDEGRTWTQSWPNSGSAPGLGAGILAVDPARPTTIYASAYYPDNRATGTHILRSNDSGLTWTVAG